MRTYAQDAQGWRDYQPHLPARLRLPDDGLPSEQFWHWRGLEIHLDRFEAANTQASVIFCHGAGGYGRMLAPYGRALGQMGYTVVLPDLPGYGLSAVPGGRMRYPLWVDLVADLAAAERLRSGRPVILMGASMGGMLCLHAAGQAPPGTVAAVIATTLIDPRRREVRTAVSRLPGAAWLGGLMALLPWLRLPMPWLARMDAMSSIPALNQLCARDRLGGGNRVPLGFLSSWMNYRPGVEARDFDRCPVLLAHPAADRWTPTTLSLATLRQIAAPTRFTELPRCEHLPIEEPGFSRLLQSTADFLQEVLGPSALRAKGA